MSDWRDRSGFAAAQRAYDYQEPPATAPVRECGECGRGIYTGEIYYNVGNVIYCESCLDEFRFTAEN